jgi:hypothetical protein
MPFLKGQSGNIHGRPKGSKNIYKAEIEKVFADYNPLQRLKELSLTTDDDNLRQSCDKELAQYYAPKLKAIEHSGDVGLAVTHDLAISSMAQQLDKFDSEQQTE